MFYQILTVEKKHLRSILKFYFAFIRFLKPYLIKRIKYENKAFLQI